jgi:hypothetical protein
MTEAHLDEQSRWLLTEWRWLEVVDIEKHGGLSVLVRGA